MIRQVQSLHPDALAAWSELGAAIMHGPSTSDAAPARNDRDRRVGDESLQLLNDRSRRGSPYRDPRRSVRRSDQAGLHQSRFAGQ